MEWFIYSSICRDRRHVGRHINQFTILWADWRTYMKKITLDAMRTSLHTEGFFVEDTDEYDNKEKGDAWARSFYKLYRTITLISLWRNFMAQPSFWPEI